MSRARFEIVRHDEGYFARYVAANNRIVWVTPGLYARLRDAENALESMTDRFIYRVQGKSFITNHGGIQRDVKYLDERHPEDR